MARDEVTGWMVLTLLLAAGTIGRRRLPKPGRPAVTAAVATGTAVAAPARAGIAVRDRTGGG